VHGQGRLILKLHPAGKSNFYQTVGVITFQLRDEFKTRLRTGIKPCKKRELNLDLIF
jgi:hypothetical protein